MKYFLKLLLLTIMFLPSYLLSDNSNVYDIVVKQANYKKIENYVNKLNTLGSLTKHYIITTGDLDPTTDKIINFYNLNNENFKNYNGNDIEIIVYNDFIKFKNIFDDSNSLDIINTFKESSSLNSLFIISDNEPYNIYLLFNSEELDFIQNLQNIRLNSNIIISDKEPYNKFIVWYKPNGNGDIDIYLFIDGIWKKHGSFNLNDENNREIVVDSIETLKKLTPSNGTKAIINSEEKGDIYIYSEKDNKWYLLNEGSKGDDIIFEIIDNINILLDRTEIKLYDAGTNSQVIVNNLLNNTNIEFLKMTNFWVSINRYNIPSFCGDELSYNALIFITENIKNLPNSSFVVPTCSVAYSKENNSIGYKGDNNFPEYVFINEQWINIIPSLNELVINGNKNNTYFIKEYNNYFNHYDIYDSLVGYWKGGNIIVTNGSRKDMIAEEDVDNYYSFKLCQNIELCSKDNIEEPRYSDNGVISSVPCNNSVGYFYQWYKNNYIKSINGLSDIK